ncbi:hypothetical protein DRN97_00745 [Methanosarcinales archaeon]|nr:MAG: hypothetical protein DRN97_00745 [Methanosarcinales archaeon]
MDKNFYSWIPILSRKLVIGEKLFCDADINNFEKLFISNKMLLSDRRFDRLFNRKHKVSYGRINFRECEECGEKILHLSLNVLNWKGEILVDGDAWIHESGLTKYKVSYPENDCLERVLHILVRDALHSHVHHSSDLPLPPIEAKNGDEAKKSILFEYLRKFVEYKRMIGKVRLKDAIEDIARARGEIVYANSFYDTFRERLADCSDLVSSFKSFDKSFMILEKRLSDRLHLVPPYILVSLSALILFLSLFRESERFPQWIIPLKTISLYWYWPVYAFLLTIFLYFITEAVIIWFFRVR